MKKALVFLTIATISTLTLAGCGTDSSAVTENSEGSIETTEHDTSDFDQPAPSSDSSAETEVAETTEATSPDSEVDSTTVPAVELPDGVTVRNPANTPLCGGEQTVQIIEISKEDFPKFNLDECELSEPYLDANCTSFGLDSFLIDSGYTYDENTDSYTYSSFEFDLEITYDGESALKLLFRNDSGEKQLLYFLEISGPAYRTGIWSRLDDGRTYDTAEATFGPDTCLIDLDVLETVCKILQNSRYTRDPIGNYVIHASVFAFSENETDFEYTTNSIDFGEIRPTTGGSTIYMHYPTWWLEGK